MLHIGELLLVEAVRIVDETVGIGQGDNLRTQAHRLLGRILGHVAGTGNDHGLAIERLAAGPQHLLREIAGAVTGGLRTQQAATPGLALAGQGAGELVTQPLVLAEKETNLSAADADIAGRYVRIRTDILLELRHEGLAEAHHLRIRLAPRIEIGSALGATHRKGGQTVLEGLLESEELHDAEVHARMETDAALVGADRAVHLDPETAVDVDLAAVIHPGNAENDHPFGLYDALHDLVVQEMGIRLQIRRHAGQYLPHSLMELKLTGVLRDQVGHEGLDVLLGKFFHKNKVLH